MSAHVEFHDPTVAAVSVAPPFHTWDGATPVDEDRWDADAAIDEGHYGLVIDCVENVAVFEGTPAELARMVQRIHDAWAAFVESQGDPLLAVEPSLPGHLIVVEKDSCEAEHPTKHLQCHGAYAHEQDGERHYIGDGEEWD